MPRNSSGTMTLPAPGVPFQSGQTISSAQVNATLTDLATEVGSSLDRSGRGGALAPIRGVDGTVAAPAVSFTGEPASGLYRAAANDVRLAVGGVDMLTRTGIVFPAQPVITTSNADTSVQIAGNKAAGSIGAELEVFSKVSRTAGLLAQFWNLNFPRLNLDYQGLLRLDATAVAAAIQPASIWTAITPSTGWTAINGLAYWKDASGKAHFKGGVRAVGTPSVANVLAVPAGFRPGSSRSWIAYLAIAATGGQAFGNVTLDTTGVLSVFFAAYGQPQNSDTIYLDGVSFLAEG